MNVSCVEASGLEVTVMASCTAWMCPAQAGLIPRESDSGVFAKIAPAHRFLWASRRAFCGSSQSKRLRVPASRKEPSISFSLLDDMAQLAPGLIMFAKTYKAFYDLQLQLHFGMFGREYTSLAHGWLPSTRASITAKARSAKLDEATTDDPLISLRLA